MDINNPYPMNDLSCTYTSYDHRVHRNLTAEERIKLDEEEKQKKLEEENKNS